MRCQRRRAAPDHGAIRPRGGRRQQRARSGFRTQRDAKIAREALVLSFRAGTLPTVNHRITTGEYLASWLAGKINSGSIRPSTARSYAHHINFHLVPRLGSVRLSELRAAHIEAAYAAITHERGVSAHTIHRIHATIRAAIRSAVKRGELAHDHTAHVSLPATQRLRVRPWEPAEFGRFLDAIENHRLSALFHTAGFTGLRRGEICGLRWQDIDLRNSCLTVHQQAVQVGNEVVLGKPKTRSGEGRVVDLDAGTVAALQSWHAQQAAERLAWGPSWESTGLVFTKEDGTGLHPEYVTKSFERAVRGAGVRRIRLHDLRHGAASLRLAAGVPLAIVAKQLGHSSVSLTADTYSHLIGQVGREASEAAAALVPRARLRP